MESQEIPSTPRCSVCGSSFSRNSSLKRHVLKFHPGREKDIIPQNEKNFKCDKCNKSFAYINNLRQHERLVHKIKPSSSLHQKCVFCEFTNSKRENVLKHYEENHDSRMEYVEVVFKDKIEFENWKKAEEKNTNTFFSKTCSYSDPRNGFNRLKFICNRSGFYKPKGKGVRKLRNLGSLKIGGVCPAEMDVMVYNDNKYVVKYLKSHCGHENDLQNLYLSKDQKDDLAVKIAGGLPYRIILDEVRDSLQLETNLERVHLISRKDLYNIARCYQLENFNTTSVDALSIEEWTKEMSDRGSVIYHKLRGSFCNKHPELHENDFVMVIMNQCQKQTLQNYASDCICIDRTHCLNSDKLELVSLLVVDETSEALPCAFLFSNRVDSETILLFYTSIKEALENSLKTNIFMSDLDSMFYSSWLEVMDPPCFRFFCPWHVEKTWRNDLQKIKSTEVQFSVYEGLKSLQQQEYEENFDIALDKFKNEWSIKETKEFLEDLQQKFLNNTELWADYHKIRNNINLSCDLDITCEEITKLYVFGKNNNHLNLAITALMNYVTNKILQNNSKKKLVDVS